jgi:exodeoxyribonuclease-3
MRIVSWNILAGGGRRVDRIAEWIASFRPSLVALCEFRDTPPSRSLASQLSAIGLSHQRTTASSDDRARNALLVASRWPLRRLATGRGPCEPARWMGVRVAAPKPFLLGAMHVPNRDSGRKYVFHDAVVDVARSWRGRPAILVGDTNSGWPDLDEEVPCFGPKEAAFLEAMRDLGWADAYRHLHGDARSYTWYSPNGRNGFRLDQTFASPALAGRLRSASYSWAGGPADRLSDHAAQIVDFFGRPREAARRGSR